MSRSDLVEQARDLAIEAHRGQEYAPGTPYWRHLETTVATLELAGFAAPDSEEERAAAWLHDILEDTGMDKTVIGDRFGPRVRHLVLACTAKYGNRRQRLSAKIRQLTDFPDAIPVVLADRTANVENCWRTRDARLFMYHREHRILRKALFHLRYHFPPNVAPKVLAMWTKLDELLNWSEKYG